jgi:plastocyanin
MRRIPLLLLICGVAALGFAGCGGDDNGGSNTSAATTGATGTSGTTGTTGAGGAAGGLAGTIKISADPSGQLAFQQKSVTAKAGKNKIEFDNPSSVPHDVKIEEDGKEKGGTDLVTNGTADATLTLDAGEPYVFFCSVPGHRQAGMEGKLTVTK